MDFRVVRPCSLKWLPQVRQTVPVAPATCVQTPPSACDIALLPGRYALTLSLAGHAAHTQFLDFVFDLEEHAQRHARRLARHGPNPTWRPCIDAGGLVPTMRLSAFDDAKFFDRSGGKVFDPTGFQACSCLLELTGVWVAEASWGLRWKVLEVKEAPAVPVVPCLIGPPEPPTIPCLVDPSLDD
jgi:hypothetical protein